MKTDKYIKSISFKIGDKTITADEAKAIMNNREYKIEMSEIKMIGGGKKHEK